MWMYGKCFFCNDFDVEPCHYEGKDVAACHKCAEKEEKAFEDRKLEDPIFARYEDCLYESGFRCGGEGYMECLEVLEDVGSHRKDPSAPLCINYKNFTLENCCSRCKIKKKLEDEYKNLLIKEKHSSEEIARSIMIGDNSAKTTFLEWIKLRNHTKLASVIFALQILTSRERNNNVGETAWEALDFLTTNETQSKDDASLIGRLFTLLTLNQPEFLSGAARKIFPQTRDSVILLETTLSLRSAFAIL